MGGRPRIRGRRVDLVDSIFSSGFCLSRFFQCCWGVDAFFFFLLFPQAVHAVFFVFIFLQRVAFYFNFCRYSWGIRTLFSVF